MSFKDLELGSTYNSSRNDLIEDFYIPVLSEAKSYDRVTGYFDSDSLVLAATGLKEFISNHGKMRLLCGTNLKEMDVEAVVNASEIAEFISDNFLEDLDSISDEIYQNNVKLLAWMVDNDYLEIKIGIVKDEDGYHGGILHEKTGILSDENDDILLFSGSNNETGAGWRSKGLGNIEKFKVFNSWEDKKFISEDIESFEDDWNDLNKYLEVIDIPSAAKEGLVKRAPDSFAEVMDLIVYESEKYKKSKDTRELREYQKDAISAWCENNNRGIFEMATGTGKTFTSLNCMDYIFENNPSVLSVVACPYAHLAEQWGEDIKNYFDIPCYDIYSSSNSNWKKDLTSLIFKLNCEIIDKAIILTTHTTYSMDFFITQISELDIPLLLVVDEMHHVISKSYREGLLDSYNYRLGLSATPESKYDEENTNLVFDYFGGIVYDFGMSQAMTEFDDSGNTFLAPYDYFPKKVTLNSQELADFIELSKKIKRLAPINKNKENKSFQMLLMKRSNIIKNAESKYGCLREILRSYDDLDHLIVFCSPQQINHVLSILKEEGVSPVHRFTSNEGTKKSKQFGGLSQREFLVEKFDQGYYKSLVAIKCLDEGVDVPSAEKVIIMASSNNPREYIQRRGRVLRRYENKDKAEIYDMAVIEYDSLGEPINDIVGNEKERLLDFIKFSTNTENCMELLRKWRIVL